MADVYFTGITVWRATFPLRLAFSHNLASRDAAETLLATITTSNGGVGWGQCLPRAYLTGESMDSAIEDISERWWPGLQALSFPENADYQTLLQLFSPLFRQADAGRRNASFAAIDVAAMDAALGAGGWRPGRGEGVTIPLVGAIPAVSPGKAAWLVRLLKWLGFRRFKVKVGRDAAADSARIAAVRRVAAGVCRLYADANAAWTWEEAVRRMCELRETGIELIEEPLVREAAANADFRRLETMTGVATMADESLCTLADAHSLLERGSPSRWNLRLAKNGGFSGFEALAEIARANEISCYGGILVGETGVLAAASQAAWSGTEVGCGEYGFSRIFVKGDPFRGSPAGYRGCLRTMPANRKGLGIHAVLPSLHRFGTQVWQSSSGVVPSPEPRLRNPDGMHTV